MRGTHESYEIEPPRNLYIYIHTYYLCLFIPGTKKKDSLNIYLKIDFIWSAFYFFHFFMFTFSNSTKAANLILQNCLIEQRRQFCQVKLKETLREFPDVSTRVTEETVTICPSYVTLDAPVAISLERDVMLVTTWESTSVWTSYSTFKLPFLQNMTGDRIFSWCVLIEMILVKDNT